MVEINQMSTSLWNRILTSDFELDRVRTKKLLESKFALTMIQFIGPNCLSLVMDLFQEKLTFNNFNEPTYQICVA